MGLLEDLNSAINDYPADNVEISIIELTGGGGHINVGEVWNFKVRVTNNGMLDMKGLRLHIQGSTWTSVGGAAIGLFAASFFPPAQDVNAHSSVTFQTFYMRADSATGNQGTVNEEIISAHISSFNADLDHILNDHGHHAGNPEGIINRHVHPS